jgi:hypothetical protein
MVHVSGSGKIATDPSNDAFLCSGFGRPQMVPAVELEEMAYLQLVRLRGRQLGAYVKVESSAYLASLVQLAKVSLRDDHIR